MKLKDDKKKLNYGIIYICNRKICIHHMLREHITKEMMSQLVADYLEMLRG
jgi:hypothetical protein